MRRSRPQQHREPTIPSNRPNTGTRSEAGIPRWRMVNPDTSRSALLTPVTRRPTTASAISGQAPMTTMGRPQRARATANAAASRGIRVSPIAPTAPSRPPSPTAAFSSPTPSFPIANSSMAATTMSVVSMPRTKTCPPKSRKTSPTSGRRRNARTAREIAIPPAPAVVRPPRASASWANRSPTSSAAAPRNAIATTTHAPAGLTPTIKPPIRGPTNAPAPSPTLLVTFAAMSSDGLRARAGISPDWIGRTKASAAATRPARTKATIGGPPTARTTAVAAAAPARMRLTATSVRSPRQRATGTSANGPTSVGGTIRMTPRIPTPIAPAAVYATMSSTIRYAQSAVIPIAHAASIRRMPGFAATSRIARAHAAIAGPGLRVTAEGYGGVGPRIPTVGQPRLAVHPARHQGLTSLGGPHT